MKEFEYLSQDARKILEKVDLSPLEGKTILITGASGQIGAYFIYSISEYVKRGGKCSCVALTYRDIPVFLRKFECENWITFVKGDVTNSDFLNSLPSADYIVHAATYGQPMRFMKNALATLKMSTVSTIALLEKLNAGGHFLFISSGAVYEGRTDDFLSENVCGASNTNHPRSCYIEGKRCGEAIVNAYRNMGVDAKSARVCLSFCGAVREDDCRVIPQLIRKGIKNGRIDLLDRGTKKQLTLYMTDCAELLLNILLYGKSDIYNVSGKKPHTIYEIALEIGSILGVPVYQADDDSTGIAGSVGLSYVDMSKAEAEFGKTEYVDLNDALRRTIELIKTIDQS